jgi:hypothetical protein
MRDGAKQTAPGSVTGSSNVNAKARHNRLAVAEQDRPQKAAMSGPVVVQVRRESLHLIRQVCSSLYLHHA